jgi:predicted ribosome quality control (RQC) complex YloA/Tae2 family protein
MSDSEHQIDTSDDAPDGLGAASQSAQAERLAMRDQRRAIVTQVESNVKTAIDIQFKDAFAALSTTLDEKAERVASQAAQQAERVANSAAQQLNKMEAAIANQADTLSLFMNAMSGHATSVGASR